MAEIKVYGLMIIIILIWNGITFLMMGSDKRRARKERQRIPERTLFLCAFLMGGPGILAGMYHFHHKTRYLSFRILVPVATLLNLLALIWLFRWIYGIMITM